MTEDKMIDFDEAVNLICKRTGMTRRQAIRSLEAKLKSGELRAFVMEKPLPRNKNTVATNGKE